MARTSNPVVPVLQGSSPISTTAPHFQFDHHYGNNEALHREPCEYNTLEEGFSPEEDEEDDISDPEPFSYGALPASTRTRRLPLRQQSLSRQPQYRPVQRSPDSASSVAYPEDYGPYGSGHAGGQHNRSYPHGAPQQQQHAAYGPFYPQNQMVGFQHNPFSPLSNVSSNASYYQEQRGGFGNDMVQQFPAPYYSHPGYVGFPFGHPATAAANPESSTRGKELMELEAKVAAFEKEKREKEQAERQREIETKAARKAAEEAQKYIEQMEHLKEQNKLEIARARTEAERTARENIEAERKAAAERAKQQDDAIKAAEERVRNQMESQMRANEAQQKKNEEDRIKAEEAAQLRLEAALRADAEMKEAQAKKAAEEELKLEQIRVEAKRKADAEMEAKIRAEKEEAARKAEEEALAQQEKEAFKKQVEEETKALLEAQAKKDRGPYIQFKDALGRKYSFPYRLCTTWPNMEELIKQAFDSLDDLGYHVQEGWYDLIGPSGDIILPSVWERVIEPDWSITMTMWPLERIRGLGNQAGTAPGIARGQGMPPIPPAMAGRGRGGIPPGMASASAWTNHHNGKNGIHTTGNSTRPTSKPKKKKQPDTFSSFFTGKPSRKK